MSLEPALLAKDVEAAFRSIRARVVEVFDQEPEARQLKLDGSVVTALDLELEATLAEALLALEPSFGLVGEESGTLRAGSPTWVLDPLGLPAVDDLPDSVEVSRRAKEGQTYTFYLNHGEAPVQVQIPAPGVDLLTGQEVGRSVELDGYGVLIVKE